ncbi:MAG: phosphoribosylglycinamide formyltransferase [Chitinophagaceae bacterium]|nr:phosphoribosylglycinamide formyltransferase [Chitinophagaceae bacterium]HMN32474.1 phosphoribosylglycinamide formyltransferase [Chitinophagaceae bacterium]
MKNVLLFASGGGSNVKAILNYFHSNSNVHFPLILTNNPDAGVIEIAESFGIDVMVINKEILNDEIFIDTIDSYSPALIVLAGFLWKIPSFMIAKYPHQIINIHPSLLPKYGGKGMYGHHVHEAVVNNYETESGITIHYVNEEYDEGAVILQRNVAVSPTDNAEQVAANVLKLEHEWYSKVIDTILTQIAH